jgi:hypothetical protein
LKGVSNLDNNEFLRGHRRELNLFEDSNNMSKEEMNKNIELFKREYYCKWKPSKEYEEAYKLWLWYNYHCEKFDSQHCTNGNEYEDYMPASGTELRLVNQNAYHNLQYINNKRKELSKQDIIITESDWLDAKKHLCRYKLKALEEEYKHYFKS